MLKERIKKDLLENLKKGENFLVEVLRTLLAAIENKEKEKRYRISKKENITSDNELIKKSELTDEEVIEIILSEIKKRRDAIELYEKGGRRDLVEKEKKEVEILQKYLPPQLSKEELEEMIKTLIEKIGAKDLRDLGKVMSNLVPLIKGKADIGMANEIVKRFLS